MRPVAPRPPQPPAASDDDDPLSPSFSRVQLQQEPLTRPASNVARPIDMSMGSAELARVGSNERMSGASAAVQPSPTPDNPTPQMIPPPTHAVAGTIGEKHVLVMVRRTPALFLE